MTGRSPITAFALLATTTALKARAGHIQTTDKLALMIGVLQCCEDHPEARVAVQDFMLSVDRYPKFAGERLQSFVQGFAGPSVGRDPLPVLNKLEAEAINNGWAERKECGHERS
jgi:hypothetical protein